jgi:hypothetical protein
MLCPIRLIPKKKPHVSDLRLFSLRAELCTVHTIILGVELRFFFPAEQQIRCTRHAECVCTASYVFVFYPYARMYIHSPSRCCTPRHDPTNSNNVFPFHLEPERQLRPTAVQNEYFAVVTTTTTTIIYTIRQSRVLADIILQLNHHV